MKKFLTIFVLAMAVFTTSKAQILPEIVVPGGQYDQKICQNSSNNYFIVAVAGDPYTFCVCNFGIGQFFNCSPGLAFNPVMLTCDYIYKVKPYYPDFPWGLYE